MTKSLVVCDWCAVAGFVATREQRDEWNRNHIHDGEGDDDE